MKQITLTADQVDAYLKAPDKCPVCRQEGVSGTEVDIEEGLAFQGMTCDTCDAEWTDVFTRTGIMIAKAWILEDSDK